MSIDFRDAEQWIQRAVGIIVISTGVSFSIISGIAGYWKWDSVQMGHYFAAKQWRDLLPKVEKAKHKMSMGDYTDADEFSKTYHITKEAILRECPQVEQKTRLELQ